MRRVAVTATLAALAAAPLACDSVRADLLSAPDPDLINPEDVANPEGAEAVRLGALGRLSTITAGGESMWLLGGLLTDEWKSGDTFTQRDETDKRTLTIENGNVTTAYRNIHRARVAAIMATKALRQYKPNPPSSIAELYFVKGFAEMTSADNFCNGQPFSDGSEGDVLLGDPVAVADAYAMAIASLDSGVAIIGSATDATSVNVARALRITKARAQLALGRYADAATTVSGIPTSYAYEVTFLQVSGSNQIWALNNSARRWTVGDSADATGTIANALPFRSAGDPRVPSNQPTAASFDGSTPFWAQRVWATRGSPAGREDPVAVVNGIDARLIEAEAQLQAGNVPGMLTTLNTLRTGPTRVSVTVTVSNMAPLTDPGTRRAQEDLLFREKAFWTFSRGQRLPDMRRLIRQYQRPQDQVFPTGRFFKGGNYGTDVNFPVPQAEQNNPKFSQCTDRNA